MRKLLFPAILITLILTACAPKIIPLKNSYSNGNYEINSNADFETVWANVIDFVAKNGVGIKLIDKSSGFIVAQAISTKITSEDKFGNLKDSTAWVVTSKILDRAQNKYVYPKQGSVEWNIYIKRDTGNHVIINVNLIAVNFDITNLYISPYSMHTYKTTVTTKIGSAYRSTSVFEKNLASIIK